MSNLYTRDDIFRMVRSDEELFIMGFTRESIKSAVDALITSLIDGFELECTLELPNLKERGAHRHGYLRYDLYKSLCLYLNKVKTHKISGRKRIAIILVESFEFLDKFKN